MTKAKHRGHGGGQKVSSEKSARAALSLKKVFASIDKIQKRIKRRPKSVTLKSLIVDGRN